MRSGIFLPYYIVVYIPFKKLISPGECLWEIKKSFFPTKSSSTLKVQAMLSCLRTEMEGHLGTWIGSVGRKLSSQLNPQL